MSRVACCSDIAHHVILILPTVSLRAKRSNLYHEPSAMSYDRVILSIAKNLNYYADLCN